MNIKKLSILILALIAFAVIFTGCVDPKPELTSIKVSVSGGNTAKVKDVLTKCVMSVKTAGSFNIIDGKGDSNIKDMSYTSKEITVGTYEVSFDIQYKANTAYVIDKLSIDGKDYKLKLEGKTETDPILLNIKKPACSITITLREASDIEKNLIVLNSDEKLSKWEVNIDGTNVTPVGSKLEGKDLLTKEYLGFDSNKIPSKITFIREPSSNHSISCDYLYKNDLENIYNNGFDKISEGLEKRWELATANFSETASPYFLNLNETFTVTKDTCDSKVGKFRHCIIDDEYYALKVAKYATDNKYYVYYDAFISGLAFNWVVVAIHKKGKNLPDYVIKAPITNFSDIKDMYANNYYDSNNIPVGFNSSDGKIALCDLLAISNDSVDIMMNPKNYDLYAIILNTDDTHWFWLSNLYGFRNVIQLNDPDFEW